MLTPKTLRALGSASDIPDNPEDAVLDPIPFVHKHKAVHSVIRFTCPEFTSLCPVTSQPDFATIVIEFVPRALLVESKSLKLFLHSFRNHGSFHETVLEIIGAKLIAAIDPIWLRIGGYFYPRGGIPIDVFYSYGKLPDGTWAPEQAVAPYRGR